MSYNQHQLQSAINSAEAVASPLKKDSEPVTVTNAELLVLIAAAKQALELGL